MKADNNMLERAISFSNAAHTGQVRKGDRRPYITHPLAVMLLVFKYRSSAKIIKLMVIALLHDVIEDCPHVNIQMIIDNFGQEIADGVLELTDDENEIKRIGKKLYQLLKWNDMTDDGFLIKLADRLHNLRDMTHIPTQSAMNQVKDTKWIIKRLDRPLRPSHKKLIKAIKKELKRKRWKE